jgi:hypothetical protein
VILDPSGRGPEFLGNADRVDADVPPAGLFVANAVDLAMVNPASGALNSSLALRTSARGPYDADNAQLKTLMILVRFVKIGRN